MVALTLSVQQVALAASKPFCSPSLTPGQLMPSDGCEPLGKVVRGAWSLEPRKPHGLSVGCCERGLASPLSMCD